MVGDNGSIRNGIVCWHRYRKWCFKTANLISQVAWWAIHIKFLVFRLITSVQSLFELDCLCYIIKQFYSLSVSRVELVLLAFRVRIDFKVAEVNP